MKKIVGIWIDKRVAKIIFLNDPQVLMTSIPSNVEDFRPFGGSGSQIKGGPQDVVHDSKFLERQKHQIKAYFKAVVESLPEADAIVIFGPSLTGKKLADEIKDNYNHLSDKIKGVERCDSLTDNQLVDWVKRYLERSLVN